MAKRRNLKKEKALRNQAYARHFRKQTNVTSQKNNGGRRYQNNQDTRDDGDAQDLND